MIPEKNYYKYWGKSKKSVNSLEYHLLVYHCLDVAAVTWHLLSPETKRCYALSQLTGLSPPLIRYIITVLMMFHDLGKFSKSFQALVPEIYKIQFTGSKKIQYEERHDTLGFVLWRGSKKDDPSSISKLISKENQSVYLLLDQIVRSGFGHHGIPPRESARGGHALLSIKTFFDDDDINAAHQFAIDCLHLLGPVPSNPEITKEMKSKLKNISWHIAGLAIITDWIGSDDTAFLFSSQHSDLVGYWKESALPQAHESIKKLNWDNQQTAPYTGIQTLFPFITTPTPLQSLASTMQLLPGPKLFIIEDVTGAGKTEAAVILASRIMGNGEADGLYIGLPTMATANAMYGRMYTAYQKLYQEGTSPSLILSHGSRHLSKVFTDTIGINSNNADTPYGTEESASAYCSRWFADNRKKALLADVGVGTIDQALTGILPARHQSLRLFGLERKVLIIDEVHAYDPYMGLLLSVLLEAHARGGGSVILLSATIPLKKKTDLIQAFQKGLGQEEKEDTGTVKSGFPLLAQVSSQGTIFETVPTRKEVERQVDVECINNYNVVLSTIEQKAMSGECVCWVRNTVKDARKAYHDLRQMGFAVESIDLFHSRFAMIDRIRIENDVIGNFGKTSGESVRKGRVLIATQVVELD